jgi:hypothetical protein
MLRQIVPLSLVMIVGATFMPSKANAISLTFERTGDLLVEINDPIVFNVNLEPSDQTLFGIIFRDLTYSYDDIELAFDQTSKIWRDTTFGPGEGTKTIANLKFNVRRGVRKDEGTLGDLSALLATYDTVDSNGNIIERGLTISTKDTVDVLPVPEPLTIFGTATALGCGVLFKRKSSKKTVS